MIAENRYHRKRMKALISENESLKKELATAKGTAPVVDFEGIIEEQVREINTLKKKIQGYKMQIAKNKNKEKK